jgi:hypothetical protein
MHDRYAIAREMDIELEAVGAGRKAALECWNRVLGTERPPAPVREHERRRLSIGG